MLSLNFYAQPSAGKSTSAAYVFAYLKNRACNVELVTEYAKSMVYSQRQLEMANQLYMLSKQYKKMDDIRVYEHVPMVITDSPLILGMLYSAHLPYFKELRDLAFKLHDSFENINILVNRTKPYNPSGRNQDEAGSDALIPLIKNLGVKFDYEMNGDEEGQLLMAARIYEDYKERIKIPGK